MTRRRPANPKSDLKRCLAAWERERRIDDFPLGQRDTPARLFIPEKLCRRVHPDLKADIEEYIEKTSTGIIASHTGIVLPDGTLKYIHSASHPIFDDAGKV
jgi:hypothetical protein